MGKIEGRGGRREGAGRPSNDSKLYTFRAPGQLARMIDAQENKTDFIKACIVRALDGGSERADERMAMGSVPLDGIAGIEEKARLRRMGEVVSATEAKGLTLPFFDIGIVAGFPIPLDNDERAQSIDILRMLCPNPEACYLIRVAGQSMIDAGIHDGDIVIVDKSNRHPSASEVAVCEYNGEYTLKHFVKKGNTGWLVPANPDFPEIEVKEGDLLSVWGTVTYVIHRPKD